MSLVVWNCRGVGSPSTIPDLKYLVRHFNPDVLFLSETLAHGNKIEELRYLHGYDSCFHVDRTGRGGGLALFWRNAFNCQLIDFSNNHITIEVTDTTLGIWRITGYYGYPHGSHRIDAWNFLRQLYNRFAGPWCIFGDFNDILEASEKRGRTIRPHWLINGFRQAVLDAGLSDVPFDGYPFTWFKSLGTPRAVEERLDRALATNSWFDMFPNASVENLVAPASDHYPILLQCSPRPRPISYQRRFRYENAWHLEPGFTDLVTNSWQVHSNNTLISKLSSCAAEMTSWKKTHCHKLKSAIEECWRHMQDTRLQASGEDQGHMLELRKRMQRVLSQDDAYWRQRAKTHWYKDGDRNTKFFHASATARKKVNRILSLEDDVGNKITSDHGLKDVARNYFVNIFQQQDSDFSSVLDVINPLISDNDNDLLMAPFTKAEFREAIFSMHPDKCSGPASYSPGFYQHFWTLCNDDIFKECCAWLTAGQFPSDLNITNIALIPKGSLQVSMKDWRGP